MNTSVHIDVFEKELKRRNYSLNSIKNYVSCAKVFFSQSKSDHPKNIHEKEIKEFLGRKNIVNTQRNYHSAIKKYYNIVYGQPSKFKYIPYARKEKKLPIILSVEEIQRMFDVCKNKKHLAIFALLYSCSLRVSEVINLEWKHIDRSRMIINIVQAKGKKDRQVGLNEALIKILTEYCLEYKMQKSKYVFCGQNSEQYTQSSILSVVKQLAEKAQIKKSVKTHLIRHCSATHFVEQGLDINLLQKWLGHSNVKTTMIYTHISHNLISKIQSPLQNIRI